ncbi:zinc finger and SCAN domain-containing protein 2-like [Ptychodera flava]|uniref:zinc finger and SCAN domain-containing protein 2-like n=1 Tax=Ptychodera flava TaxID=63121 RepID=UPI003969D125
MATGTIDQAVIDEQFLQCSICVDRFVHPKVLPKCGHIFCKGCLSGVLRANGDEMLICPICRTDNTSSVRDGNIERLPDSHLAKSLIELVSTAVIQQTQGLEANQLKANGLDSGLSDFPIVEAYTSPDTAASNSTTAIPHQYMCFVCARDFNDSRTLQCHMEQCLLENASILSSAPRHTNADDSPSYSCPVCQVECQDESSLHIHVDMCLQSAESSDLTTPYTCPICQLQFDDEGILHAHVDSCLSDEPTDVVTSNSPGMRGAGELNGGLSAPSSPRPSYLCPLCESVFSSMDELADHKAHCSHGCSRETRAGRDEATAAVSEFQVRAADTVNLGEFALNTCPACRLTFADTACYLSHIPQCTPEDSSAFSQANLSGFPPNTCPDCRQTFANSASYQSHIPRCSPDDAAALSQET